MFGLPPEIVVFDTEYTAWEGSMARNWTGPNEAREIVEIGAVCVETEAFTERGAFDILVQPVKNPKLSPYFITLTAITQERVDREGRPFAEALRAFSDWSAGRPLYSWGGDDAVLRENCDFAAIAFPFPDQAFADIKQVFEAAGIKTDGYMSSTIVRALGREPARRAHGAANDARTIVDGLRALRDAERGELQR